MRGNVYGAGTNIPTDPPTHQSFLSPLSPQKHSFLPLNPTFLTFWNIKNIISLEIDLKMRFWYVYKLYYVIYGQTNI